MRIIPDIFQKLIIYRPSHPIFTPPLIGTAVISLTEETDAEGLSNIPKVTLSDKTEIGTSKVHALKLNHLATIPDGLHLTVRQALLQSFSPFVFLVLGSCLATGVQVFTE